MQKIVCVGEIVWDVFPDKKVLGGAPLNVAYHLSNLIDDVVLVSKVGNDNLGEEALQKISSMGLSTEHVQQDRFFPTGIVNIVFKDGKHSFEIKAPSAWDHIDEPEIDEGFILVFGTLAQRDADSKNTIRSMISRAGLKFYDVNLRQPYTIKKDVLDSLGLSDVVKMNADELKVIGRWCGLDCTIEDMAGRIKDKFSLEVIIVTRGSKGAFLICAEGIFEHPGFKVDVEDTVGSGDSFFAVFIEGYINKIPWNDILEKANRTASYVATQKGATPLMRTSIDSV